MTSAVRELLHNAAGPLPPAPVGAEAAMQRGQHMRWTRRVQIAVPVVAALAVLLFFGRGAAPIDDAQRIAPAEEGERAPRVAVPDGGRDGRGDGSPSGVTGIARERGTEPRPEPRPAADHVPPSRDLPSLGLSGRLAFTAMDPPPMRSDCLDSPCFHHSPSDIRVMDVASRDVSTVTSSPLFEQGSTWSPDGSRLAYSLARGDTTASLYTVDADGTDNRQIFAAEGDSIRKPTWSPDGRTIAFVRQPTSGPSNFRGSSQIWMVDADGSNPRRVEEIRGTDLAWDYPTSPAWSPGGRHLAFVRLIEQGPRLELLDLETKKIEIIGSGSLPVWAPDGKRIAVQYEGRIEVIDLASKEVVDRIGRSGRTLGEPAWSPDGRWIAFASSSADAPEREIWVARANGDDMSVVVEGDQEYWAPTWTR